MKKLAISILFVFIASGTFAAEKYSLIKISGFDKSSDYRVLNSEELADFKKALSDEGKYFSSANNAAKKAWSKDESKKGKRFPLLSKRTFRAMKTYTDRAEADKKAASYAPKPEPAPAKKKKGAKPTVDKKADSAKAKQALMDEAIALLTAQITEASGGEVTVSLPGNAPSGGGGGKQDAGPSAKADAFKFSFTGTIYKTPGSSDFYIKPDEGTIVNGKEPWALDIGTKGKKFKVDQSWEKKKVKISATADLDDRGTQVKFSKLISIESLELVE